MITIRSRCRQVWLTTPSDKAVAELLVSRDGMDADLAAHAARVAQGHIGRARHIARSEEARNWRAKILAIPAKLRSVSDCLAIADELVKDAADEAARLVADSDTKEKADLQQALGAGTKGVKPRNTQAALKDLEEQQKARLKRIQRDTLDRALTELTTYYRDIFGLQTKSLEPINAEYLGVLQQMADSFSAAETLRKITAILDAREALNTNVAPLLAMEAMLLSLRGDEMSQTVGFGT
ncbi:MAG: hypothetical protein CR979_01665 [Propionibacterium sp.]|nr:MAG: hypothetical protein CR979_01665 [Propionibacterium sp.]